MKYQLIYVLVSAALVAAGCGKQIGPDNALTTTADSGNLADTGKRQYTINRGDYAFWYPGDWVLKQAPTAQVRAFVLTKTFAGKSVDITVTLVKQRGAQAFEQEFAEQIFGPDGAKSGQVEIVRVGERGVYKAALPDGSGWVYAVAWSGGEYPLVMGGSPEAEPAVLELLTTAAVED